MRSKRTIGTSNGLPLPTLPVPDRRGRSSGPGKRARRGFSLLELLSVLFMLTVFMGFMSRLFVTQVRALENANRTTWVIGRFDQLVAQMRKDVWNSTQVEVLDSGVYIHQSEGPLIQWSFADDQLTRRERQGATIFETKTWKDLGLEPRFELDGDVLELTLPAGTPHGGRRIRFQSQLELATKGGS